MMAAEGPTARTPASAPNTAVLVTLLLAVTGSGCGGFHVAGPAATTGGEDAYADGSADGAGDPAGIAELLLGEPLEEEAADATGAVRLHAAAVEADLLAGFPAFLDAGLPPEALDQVRHYVGLFHAGRARTNFETWLGREGRYRELILAELASAGLPEELLYLAMLESGFSPVAVSRAQAVGLWQFIASTGRASGLRIDDWVDERRDPIASTRAAIRHLGDLHRELGDWALAAAAYNAGLGRVRRTRGDSDAGYFDLTLSGRLPAETRTYVPLILAASHVARNREHYDFGHVLPEPPFRYDTLAVDGRTRLSAVARATGIPLADLRALNAHLIRGAAPPGRRYIVRIPADLSPDRDGVAQRLAALTPGERLLPEYLDVVVVVRPGDSWWRIAHNHGVTVNELRARNPRVGDIIHPGQRLVVQRRAVVDDATMVGTDPDR